MLRMAIWENALLSIPHDFRSSSYILCDVDGDGIIHYVGTCL